MARKLTDRQDKLLRFLQNCESRGRRTSRLEMARKTGYSINSIRPYVAKGMLKKWLREVPGTGSFEVKGILTVTTEQFRVAMSQKKA